MRLAVGATVSWKQEKAVILELKNIKEAIIFVLTSQRYELVRLSELEPFKIGSKAFGTTSIHAFTPNELKSAQERYEIILPLIDKPKRSLRDIEAIAQKYQKGPATIYRWLKRFEETRLTSSLLREKRNDTGGARLDEEVECLIQKHIAQDYLVAERPSVVELHELIKANCLVDGLPPPHINTIYSRVRALNQNEVVRKRYSPAAAKQIFGAVPGHFPHDDIPYSVVQIDHTPVDVIIVDDMHRLPIGKPYLTIAIDIATKMIGGFVIDLHAPSALTAGLCVALAMSKKDSWLAQRGLDFDWPIYGHIQKIHVDNASEFRGTMLERASKLRSFVLENRPKGQPRYGGHVERGFRTFMKRCQRVRGTTHGSVALRAEYNSEGKACLTLTELEKWLSVYILQMYHNDGHAGQNNQAPIQKFRELVIGSDQKPGAGMPIPIVDEETLRLDLTPYFKRTIQRTGVSLDKIHYYSPVLSRWIGTKESENSDKPRKFIFARDPRSLKQLYFWDPDVKEYFEIPYKNLARPDINIWEHREARRKIKTSPYMTIDEEAIFKGVLELRAIEQKAIEQTRLKRQSRASEKRRLRNQQKRINDARTVKPEARKPNPILENISTSDMVDDINMITAYEIHEE